MTYPVTAVRCPHSRVQHIINAVARLSAHLRATRDDHGELPAALGRADIESFLHRLAYLESAGQLSRDQRVRICQDPGGCSAASARSAWPRPASRPPGWARTSC